MLMGLTVGLLNGLAALCVNKYKKTIYVTLSSRWESGVFLMVCNIIGPKIRSSGIEIIWVKILIIFKDKVMVRKTTYKNVLIKAGVSLDNYLFLETVNIYI